MKSVSSNKVTIFREHKTFNNIENISYLIYFIIITLKKDSAGVFGLLFFY